MRKRVGDRFPHRHAHHRQAQTQPDPVRQREAGADAGERTRSDRDRDQSSAGWRTPRGLASDNPTLPRHLRQDRLLPLLARFGARGGDDRHRATTAAEQRASAESSTRTRMAVLRRGCTPPRSPAAGSG